MIQGRRESRIVHRPLMPHRPEAVCPRGAYEETGSPRHRRRLRRAGKIYDLVEGKN